MIIELKKKWYCPFRLSIRYRDYVHFKGEGNKSRRVEPGDIIIGWHKEFKSKSVVFGNALVLKTGKETAKVKLLKYIEF